MHLNKIKYLRTLLYRINRMYCTNHGKDITSAEIPPEPTNCCMSGCANCVWIEYAETLAKLFKDGGEKARQLILDKVQDPNMRAYLSMELRSLDRLKDSTSKTNEISNNGDPK